MKIRIAIAVLLVALIGELLWLSAAEREEYDAAVAKYEIESAEIAERAHALSQKKAELDQIDTDGVRAVEGEVAQLEAQAAEFRQSADAIPGQMEDLQTKLDELQAEYEAALPNYEYYMEVYNVLAEGLEKVEGYIAGD